MEQRQLDEMFFTTVLSLVIMIETLNLNWFISDSAGDEIEFFGSSIIRDPSLALNAAEEIKIEFCEHKYGEDLSSIQTFVLLIAFYTFGLISSLLQRIIVLVTKNPKKTEFGNLIAKALTIFLGLAVIDLFFSKNISTVYSQTCQPLYKESEWDFALED